MPKSYTTQATKICLRWSNDFSAYSLSSPARWNSGGGDRHWKGLSASQNVKGFNELNTINLSNVLNIFYSSAVPMMCFWRIITAQPHYNYHVSCMLHTANSFVAFLMTRKCMKSSYFWGSSGSVEYQKSWWIDSWFLPATCWSALGQGTNSLQQHHHVYVQLVNNDFPKRLNKVVGIKCAIGVIPTLCGNYCAIKQLFGNSQVRGYEKASNHGV